MVIFQYNLYIFVEYNSYLANKVFALYAIISVIKRLCVHACAYHVDASLEAVWSGSALFTILSALLDTLTGSWMEVFKFKDMYCKELGCPSI